MNIEELTRVWKIKRDAIKRKIWEQEREQLLKERAESFNLESMGLLKEEVK